MPYNANTLPEFSIKEASLGPVEIALLKGPNYISRSDCYALYSNKELWMTHIINDQDEAQEQYSSYDQAYGDVLITGLGFGILALWLCSKPEVDKVTVLEISPEVVSLFKDANKLPDNLEIIVTNASTYKPNKKYDCIFLDHYETQPWDDRLKDMQNVCSNIEHDVFWAWSLEQAYMIKYLGVDGESNYNLARTDDEYTKSPFLNLPDLSVYWLTFVKSYFPNELSLHKLPLKTVNEYIYTYYHQDDFLKNSSK